MKKIFYLSIFFPIILSLFFSFFFISIFQNPNSSYLQNHTLFLWPTPGYTKITSPFGYRSSPTKGAGTYHGGIDIGAPENTSILAIADGIISYIGWYGANGYTVIVAHEDNYTSIYGHISPVFLVSIGDSVKKGDTIAKVGPKYISKKSYTSFQDESGKYTNGATTRSTFTFFYYTEKSKNKSSFFLVLLILIFFQFFILAKRRERIQKTILSLFPISLGVAVLLLSLVSHHHGQRIPRTSPIRKFYPILYRPVLQALSCFLWEHLHLPSESNAVACLPHKRQLFLEQGTK